MPAIIKEMPFLASEISRFHFYRRTFTDSQIFIYAEHTVCYLLTKIVIIQGRFHSQHSFTDYEHHRPGGIPEPNIGISTERLLEQQSAPASFYSSDDNISTIPTTFIAIFQALLLVSTIF